MRFASDIFTDGKETMGLPIGFGDEIALLPGGVQGDL